MYQNISNMLHESRYAFISRGFNKKSAAHAEQQTFLIVSFQPASVLFPKDDIHQRGDISNRDIAVSIHIAHRCHRDGEGGGV